MKETIIRGDKLDSIIPMEPADFMIMRNQQEMLTSPQLSAYIDKQRQRGIANIKEFEIEYHKRIAMSFASFILTVIGYLFLQEKQKGNGVTFGNRAWFEFLIHPVPDRSIHFRSEWKYASGDRNVDS